MANVDHEYDETNHWSPRQGHENGETVALVTEPAELSGLGCGLAIHGYETAGYLSGTNSREWLGGLASHIVETEPDAVVALVHPDARDIFLQAFDGVLPFVLLNTGSRMEVRTSLTTQIYRARLLPSQVAVAIHEVIAQARLGQGIE